MNLSQLQSTITEFLGALPESERPDAANLLRRTIHNATPQKSEPVGCVIWVPLEMVTPNDYNPNSVARIEMGLLYTSIKHDGYTQPTVTIIRKKAEIHLPCGHKSTVDSEVDLEESPIWKIIDPLSGLSDIRLELSTEKEQSRSFTAQNPLEERVVTGCKSVKPTQTMDVRSANGCATSGEWAASINSTDSALSTSGTSHESTTSTDCCELVCPSCSSNDPERKNSWTSYLVKAAFDAGFGLRVSCQSCVSAETQLPQLKSPHDFNEALTPCAPSETNSASVPRLGTHAPILRVLNESKAVIVDGFHRYYTMKTRPDIYARCGGRLPIVVIEKSINERMASTVRHNRARGKHSVNGMANMVFSMLDNGWEDAAICNELGMSAEELLRLKHITGFSKLFQNEEYRRAWVTDRQTRISKEWQANEDAKRHTIETAHGTT